MIIYGDDSTRFATDGACVRLHIACAPKRKSCKFLARSCEMLKGFYPSVADSFPSWASPVEKEGTISTAAVRISMVQPTPHTLFYCISYPSSGSRATRHGRLSTRARRVCSIFFSLFGYKSRVDLLLDCLFGFVSYPIRFGKLKNILFFFSDCVIVSEVVAPRWNRRRLDAVALIYSSLVFSIIGSMARVDSFD